MSYLALRYLHITCVILSGCGFVLRGTWMFIDSPMLRRRWVRVLPHIVDTVLLGSAIALAVVSHQYPFVFGWLTAKVAGLLVYILCGMMALRRGRTLGVRAVFFVAALLSYAYIISVALTRNPLGFLVWFLAA
jgi:uncharacterized membrane protein SirB2